VLVVLDDEGLLTRITKGMDPAHAHVYLCGNPKMIGVPENVSTLTAMIASALEFKPEDES